MRQPARRARMSAGILLYRNVGSQLEVLLVHPGGPYFAGKESGAWSIPKGELDDDEEPLMAAQREFTEETGFSVTGPFLELVPVRLKSGKLVLAWACEGDLCAEEIRSNEFSLEWPPKSGTLQRFPEVDRAAWCTLSEAINRINPAQAPLLLELEERLRSATG